MKTYMFIKTQCTGYRKLGRTLAFTLIEVLLSMVILAMIMLIVTQVIGQAQKSWKAASSRVTQFREARAAFDTLTRNLRQATLPTYNDWLYGTSRTPTKPTDVPTGIQKSGDLGFVADRSTTLVVGGGSGDILPGHAVIFQAPIGLSDTPASSGGSGALEYAKLKSLLNARGYFVRFGSDSDYVPVALASKLQDKYRYRLYEYRPPTEINSALDTDIAAGDWAKIPSSGNYIVPVAENIVAVVIGLSFAAPEASSAPSLARPATASSSSVPFFSAYNSYTGKASGGSGTVGLAQLPRAAQLIMIAMDEDSANRLAQQNGSAPPSIISGSGASFTDPTVYDQDVERVRNAMQRLHINYRIFSAIIMLPAAST